MAETQNVREIDPTALFKQVVPQIFYAPSLFFSFKLLEYAPKHALERSFLYGYYICEITQCYAKPHFSENA